MPDEPFRTVVQPLGRDNKTPRQSSAGAGTVAPSGGATTASDTGGPDGFTLYGQLGVGGMGEVYRATDTSLRRDVAVKVLRENFPAGGLAARRFVEEARITGQLQHPGIPAVYQVGTLSDGRPFLAMKLIKGDTLAALLKRDGPGGRWLGVFEGVCQAVGYAHAHGVIHRDLKPANVMVGAFGEVQVMDWGLAKVLSESREGWPAVDPEATTAGTEVDALRAESDHTRDGQAMGTPAFMPPEQAVGAVADMDRRSDVFGLGAVLCHLLTGKPPYVGSDAGSTRQLAAQAKLADAHARLDACGAEPDLVALCKRCLTADRAERPADAGAVAEAVATLRRAADDRARQAELDRVKAEGDRAAAEAQARTQRQKRRTQLAATAGVFGLLAVGGVGWAAVRTQAAARRADADTVAGVALGRAEQLLAQADPLDPGTPPAAAAAVLVWEQAEAAVTQAEAAVESGTTELAARVGDRAATVRQGLSRARRDAALLSALVAARDEQVTHVKGYENQADGVRAFRVALTAAGLPTKLPSMDAAAAAASAVGAERPGVRGALRAAIDRLLAYHPVEGLHDGFEFGAWRVVADGCDNNAFRREVRGAMTHVTKLLALDQNPPLEELDRLVGRATAENPPTDAVVMLARTYLDAVSGKHTDERLTEVLRAARQRDPSSPDLQDILSSLLTASYESDISQFRSRYEAAGASYVEAISQAARGR